MSRAALLVVTVALLYGLHGAFASGFVPIAHAHARAQSALVFGAYFAGVVLGQLSVWRFPFWSRGRAGYPLAELGFAASLAAMALAGPQVPAVLVAGRLAEGLFAGLALPLMFNAVASQQGAGSLAARLGIMNSVFSLGFALGPWVTAESLERVSLPHFLYGFAVVFALGAGALLGRSQAAAEVTPAKSLTLRDWYDGYSTIFLAKTFYGLLLPLVSHTLADALKPLTLTQVMLLSSLVYVVSQGLTAALMSRGLISTEWARVALPALLGATLLATVATGAAWIVFIACALHSATLYAGYYGAAKEVPTAREFALRHCLTDPGMLLGAALSGLGATGLVGMALLALLPLGIRFAPRTGSG